MKPALAAASLTLCLAAAAPAQADLVIQGRAAQALHCATMLLVVSGVLHDAGMLDEADYDAAALATVVMLQHVPGTEEQKLQAVRQRGEKLIRTRTLDQLAHEFDSTAPWCQKNFL